MQDIAQPYIQTLAKELELPATSLNMQDPTIKTAMNGLNKDGKPTGKNLLDFESQLRNDPRWAKTKNAQDATMNAGFNVLQSMGLIKGNQHG